MVSRSRQRGGSPVTLIDASIELGTLLREWRCWRSGLPAISGIHAVTFSRRMASLTFLVGTGDGMKLKVRPSHLLFLLYVSSHVPLVLNPIYSDHLVFVIPPGSVTYSFFYQSPTSG